MRDQESRRRVLQLGAGIGAAAFAGCGGPIDGTVTPSPGGETGTDDDSIIDGFRGSGSYVEGRPDLEAPSIRDLPSLSGELSIYIGEGEGGLFEDLINRIEGVYPDFSATIRNVGSPNALIQEYNAGQTRADVYWAVDAGSMGAVADEGAFMKLDDETVGNVPAAFRPDNQWVSVAGRARALPYNTNELSESDLPDTVMSLPGMDLAGNMGWAPTYSAFQSFITAMRLLEGDGATRDWLSGMVDAGITEYGNEWLVSGLVADGDLHAGLANHYYTLRVRAGRQGSPPIDLAFTSGDAGALVNTSGIGVLNDTDRTQRATRFVRHLLSAEAQEFFATRTFAYPMVPGVPPAGDLPTIDELQPPDIDLAELSDIEPTQELMRDVGVL
jgi:iron(III) transport system substrate-binding protein